MICAENIKSPFAKEIAEELDELDTNDAADIIELSQDLKAEVISELNDLEHAKILSICCVMTRTLQG
jgi:magnesium transporter